MRTRTKQLVESARKAMQTWRTTTIPHSKLGDLLVFGQQHLGTQSFFIDLVGQAHTIPIARFPHFEFLDQHTSEEPHDGILYARYADASWSYRYDPSGNTPELRIERMHQFLRVFRDIESRKHLGAKAVRVPVTVCRRPDGRLIVVKGNHRACAAFKLGIDLRVTYLEPSEHIRKIASVSDDADGSASSPIPCQSIFFKETELVRGVRTDALQRVKALRADDLQGKTVLELGCKLGSNCFLATQFGAAHAVGVDPNDKMISAAVRMNAFMAAPVLFRVHDLESELHDADPTHTVFCFAAGEEPPTSTDALVRTFLAKTRKVLYWEGAPGTRQADYGYLLRAEHFHSIELLGRSIDGEPGDASRPLFRCEIRRSA